MLRSRFRDIQGHPRFMIIQGYVQGSGTFTVTFKVQGHSGTSKVQDHSTLDSGVKLARDTGCGRIDSGSEIDTRHGVW